MASSSPSNSSAFHFLVLIIISNSLLFNTLSLAKTTSFRPKALVLTITKDTSTKHIQYTTLISQRTPLVPLKLTLDLGGGFLWTECGRDYASSTYRRARCGSAQCSLARATSCTNKTCTLSPHNPLTGVTALSGALGSDIVSVRSTNGLNPGRAITAPGLLFACAPSSLLKGLAPGAKGVAGLGKSKTSLPSLLASAFGLPPKFALCLSSSPSNKGVAFFGNEPYVLLPNNDVSKGLIRTPLIANKASPEEYFIGVKAVKVNGMVVRGINSSSLLLAKISSVVPYTAMQSSIYRAVVSAFIGSIAKVPRAKSVPPFAACYTLESLGSTRTGVAVPQIDLVLQNKRVFWSIFGDNSMVEVREGIYCLGIVDGGLKPSAPIVIGSHMIEDNLLQFDLANKTLGFSSSLAFRRTGCANFNFTISA